ncbi:MAG: H-type lectin domain-containing protein [bacterium]
MNKIFKVLLGLSIFLLLLEGVSSAVEIQSGGGMYDDREYIDFEQPFSKSPVIVTSAIKKGIPLRVAPLSHKKKRFKLSIRDYEGNNMSDAWVQWISVEAGRSEDIQAGFGTYNNGEYISFAQSFSKPPIVIASARKGQFVINSHAYKVKKTGFNIKLYNRSAPEKDTIVHWIAVVPYSNSNIQAHAGEYDNGQFVNFDTPFSKPPIIVATAQKDGKAISVSSDNNSKTGFTISLYDHKNNPVLQSEVQWIAVDSTLSKSVSHPPVLSFVEEDKPIESEKPISQPELLFHELEIKYKPKTTRQLIQSNYSESMIWHTGDGANTYEYAQVNRDTKSIFIGIGVPGDGVGDVYAYGNLGVEIKLTGDTVRSYPAIIRIKGNYNGQYFTDLSAGAEVRLSLEVVDLTTSATMPSYIIPPSNNWTWGKPSAGDLTGEFDFQAGYILTTGHRYRIYLKTYLHTWLNSTLQPVSSTANIKFCDGVNSIKYDFIEITF